jgi:3-oxoacyl-[acyl-carrier-protein] synthase II
MRRAVVTGVGIVSPFGIGFERFFMGLINERSAVSNIKAFPTEDMKCKVAASIPDFYPKEFINPKELKHMARAAVLSVIATSEAIDDSGLFHMKNKDEEWENIQVIIGSGAGGIDFGERQYECFFRNELYKISPFAIPSSIPGMLSSEISIYYHFGGASHTISNGCTSSLDAIGYALNSIRTNRAKIVITGGADACITKGIIAGFERMNVISTRYNEEPYRASRPFDADRDGFVLGEGAYIFILEELEHAKRRGANIYAEVKGYGATCEAYHRVAVKYDGKQAARAIDMALKDAGLSKNEIDYINLHGTSTQMNDITETNALKYAFNGKAYSLICSATKSYVGHPQGASGACGLAATLVAMKKGYIHPTLNLDRPDSECDLNYLPNRGVEKEIRNAVINSLGFGSKNAVIVVSNWR